jgi:hypothetical protein
VNNSNVSTSGIVAGVDSSYSPNSTSHLPSSTVKIKPGNFYFYWASFAVFHLIFNLSETDPGHELPSQSPDNPDSQLDEGKEGKNTKNSKRQRRQRTHFTSQQNQQNQQIQGTMRPQ